MKKLYGISVVVITAVVMLLFTAEVGAAKGGAVYDGAGLLSTSQRERLAAEIERVGQRYGVGIGVIVQKSLQGRSPRQVADALLREGYRGRNGGIVLLIAMDTRDWHIATDDAMSQRITDDAGIKYLSGEFLPHLSGGDYWGGFSAFVGGVEKMLSYYAESGEPYDPSYGFSPLAAGLSGIIALLGGGAVRSSLIAGMSNVRPAARAGEYLVRDSLDLTEKRDTFLFMNVTRHPRPKRGGAVAPLGMGGGGGGGGGSHGGGGKF